MAGLLTTLLGGDPSSGPSPSGAYIVDLNGNPAESPDDDDARSTQGAREADDGSFDDDFAADDGGAGDGFIAPVEPTPQGGFIPPSDPQPQDGGF